MTEAEIERGARGDPDNPSWTREELVRNEGSGYQSRINAVLLGYVRSKRRVK